MRLVRFQHDLLSLGMDTTVQRLIEETWKAAREKYAITPDKIISGHIMVEFNYKTDDS